MYADELDCRARLRAAARAYIDDLEDLGYDRTRLVGLSIIQLHELRLRGPRRADGRAQAVSRPMSDASLVAQALEYRELRARAAEIEAQAHAAAAALLGELTRRGVRAVECRGVKVAALASTRRDYDAERARATVSKAVFRRITSLVVSRPALAAEIEAGRLSATDVAAFTDETTSGPYVRVSGHPTR